MVLEMVEMEGQGQILCPAISWYVSANHDHSLAS